MKLPLLDIPDDGKLAHNITHFGRALRKAGLPIGPGRILDAVAAVRAAGFSKREDFFHGLHACFVSRPEHRAVFGQVFRLFWRDPQYLEHMMSLLVPQVQGLQEERMAQAAEKRAAQALLDRMDDTPLADDDDAGTEIEIDASATSSAEQRLKTLDFEQMSAREVAEAHRILANLRLDVPRILSRRTISGRGALPDWRQTMRKASRQAGEIQTLATRRRRERAPNLVVLCDISGSMSAYSRAALHFIHGVSQARGQGWGRVHAFTFGTRLTNITRLMGNKDVDEALAAAGSEAQDWEGGTRIGACLSQFNKSWSRRTLGQGAWVLLITDGLDRDTSGTLARAAERLSLSCKSLVWLNPLLRWDDFAPRAMGIKALMPHVTRFHAGHNIASFEGLAQALTDPRSHGEKDRMLSLMAAEGGNAGSQTLGSII